MVRVHQHLHLCVVGARRRLINEEDTTKCTIAKVGVESKSCIDQDFILECEIELSFRLFVNGEDVEIKIIEQ